jgi:hypothetical protein
MGLQLRRGHTTSLQATCVHTQGEERMRTAAGWIYEVKSKMDGCRQPRGADGQTIREGRPTAGRQPSRLSA